MTAPSQTWPSSTAAPSSTAVRSPRGTVTRTMEAAVGGAVLARSATTSAAKLSLKLLISMFGMSFAQIVPCNAREYVNSRTGRTMRFMAHGKRYSVDLVKEAHRTIIKGTAWEKFIEDFGLGGGTLVFFNINARPRRAYVCFIDIDEESGEELLSKDEEDVFPPENAIAPVHETIKGVELTNIEQARLNVLLAVLNDENIGLPYVHQFTPTNIIEGVMKFSVKVTQSLPIPPEGIVGVQLGNGELDRAHYNTSIDGRLVLSVHNWTSFIRFNDLLVDDHVFISFKQSEDSTMHMMIVVNKLS